jgi:hypothetical protein
MKPNRAELKAALLKQAETNIEQFLDWLEQAPAPTLTQIEDAVLRFRQEVGRAAAETAIQAQETVTVAPGPHCPKCGREMRAKAQKTKRVTSRVGDLGVKRSHYYCSHCRRGLFPLDEQLRLWDRCCSEGVARLSVWLCGQVTAEVAEQILDQIGGIACSDTSIWRRVQRWGEKVKALEQARQQAANALPPRGAVTPVPQRLSKDMGVSMDGIKINLRQEGWKELKVGCVFDIELRAERDEKTGERVMQPHAVRNSYTAHLGGPERFGQAVWAEACYREFPLARDQVALGDGAPWIWNVTQEHFGSSRQVVDWYHAEEHLYKVGRLAFGDGSPQAIRWAKGMETPLYQGQTWRIVEAIQELAKQHRRVAVDLKTEAGYFHTNAHRMQYLELREEGFPIGSGMVESGGKQYRARLAGAGMRWSRPMAECVIPIRSAILSERFDEVWHAVYNSPRK